MMKHFLLSTALLCFGFTFFLESALADPQSDLSDCIRRSTSAKDKEALIRWTFLATAEHPAVKKIYPISPSTREAAHTETAKLLARILGRDCQSQTREVVESGGKSALQSGFDTLGKISTRELFSHPAVSGELQELKEYFNEETTKKTLKIRKIKEPPSPKRP